MDKIPLREAIKSGAWLDCHANVPNWKPGPPYSAELHYRLRVAAFDRASVEDINPSLVDKIRVEGILWLLSVEIVNLCKTPTYPSSVKPTVKLIDEDGFEFEPFESDLDPTKGTALRRFSHWGDPLSPKVKASGAIAFVLPDEENNYYLAIKDGNIREA